MITMALVSIIVPIYNSEEYLKQCLTSISVQTLQNIEILCINDGSTDGSSSIIESFCNSDPRFKHIRKPNNGYGHSMNTGIDIANGKYICIVESDDYIDENMIETLYNAIEAEKCELVKSDYYTFYSSSAKIQTYNNSISNPNRYKVVINWELDPHLFDYRMNTWTGIYLRKFLLDYKIRYNNTPGAAYQDNGFWFQTMALAKRIMFINQAFYHYRQDNPNSSINCKQKVFCICEEYEFIELFLKSQPQLFDQLYPIYIRKKYYNYIYTYNRIEKQFKLDFLYRFGKEFEQYIKYISNHNRYFNKKIITTICTIVENPQQFYIESTHNCSTSFDFIFERAMEGDLEFIKLLYTGYLNDDIVSTTEECAWWHRIIEEIEPNGICDSHS